MDKDFFAKARASLGKTQKELAHLLGISPKAVQSYEQGWRSVPPHVERLLLFLIVNQRANGTKKRSHRWNTRKCALKQDCPAWEFQAGHLCWFLSGTLCDKSADKSCKEKMDTCRQCPVLTELL